MATEVHLGHVYHVAGRPKITEADSALVEIPQGALVVEDGVITYCGDKDGLPATAREATVVDHGSAFQIGRAHV